MGELARWWRVAAITLPSGESPLSSPSHLPDPTPPRPATPPSNAQTQAASLLFGADSPAILEKRIATVQTLSGTGSLTIAAHLLKRILPNRRIFCSDPTWENHGKVVADAGAGMLEYYRYWDAATRGLDFDGMIADLNAMPEGSIVMLHAVAHNPTGVDPTRDQWKTIADVMAARKLFPWFDIAYQGFASGDLEEDAWSLRMFTERGFEMVVCQSFAKNMGLYCERVGALHIVAADAASAAAVLSNVEVIVRPMYSNPPAHGARIVAKVLSDPQLNAVRIRRGVEREDGGGKERARGHIAIPAFLTPFLPRSLFSFPRSFARPPSPCPPRRNGALSSSGP